MFFALPAMCFSEPSEPDLLRAPASPPGYARFLSPLTTSGATSATKLAEWEKQRHELKRLWESFLGPLPKEKAPLNAQFDEKEVLSTFTRQRVTYQVEEGLRTDAMVLLPRESKGPLPTVVLFHPTYDGHYRRVCGLDDTDEPESHQAVQLVQAGYAVIAPRCFLWSEIPEGYQKHKIESSYAARVRFMRERHPEWKGMTRMIWDGIRALDLAQTLSEVDSGRIGIFGHSLGAKEVVYLAAFDDRPSCVVTSEGGIGLLQSNWDAVWYLGEDVRKPEFPREHHELLAMIAPRPVLLLAGGSGKGAADTEASWHFIQSVRPVFALYGVERHIGWFNHGMGHRYGAQARPVAEKFFEEHLKKNHSR